MPGTRSGMTAYIGVQHTRRRGCGGSRVLKNKSPWPVGSTRSRSSCIQNDAWRHEMENSRYRWVIVAAGGLLGCVAIGGMFSLPVFLQPIVRDTGWSVTGVARAVAVGFLAVALTSLIWGTFFDPVGPPPGGVAGSVLPG